MIYYHSINTSSLLPGLLPECKHWLDRWDINYKRVSTWLGYIMIFLPHEEMHYAETIRIGLLAMLSDKGYDDVGIVIIRCFSPAS